MMNRRSILGLALGSAAANYTHAQTAEAGRELPGSGALAGRFPLPPGTFDPYGLISPGPYGQLVTQGSGFGFTEGPAVDRSGNVFFTDQPNDRIHRWDARTGEISLFKQGVGRANGMFFDANEHLIACCDMKGELWKIFPDGSHVVLVNNYQGKLLNGPNDVWINPMNGGMYITDPMFPRGYWETSDPRRQNWEPTRSEQAAKGKGGHVYFLASGAKELVRVTNDAMGWESDSWPNGVVGTPDGKKLYVNKWYYDNKGGTWVFDINSDGTLSNMKKFIDYGGDGMSMDNLGNVYISNGLGLMAFDPAGNNILKIPTGTSGATNNTFAGRDNKTLIITGPTDSVTAIKLKVKGARNW